MQLSDVVGDNGPSLATLKTTFTEKVLPAFREIRGLKALNKSIFADVISVCRGLENIKVKSINVKDVRLPQGRGGLKNWIMYRSFLRTSIAKPRYMEEGWSTNPDFGRMSFKDAPERTPYLPILRG